jgi:hypothetical protein
MTGVHRLKTYSGTVLQPGEKRVVDNNFKFIEQRATEAMKMYADAKAQELRKQA